MLSYFTTRLQRSGHHSLTPFWGLSNLTWVLTDCLWPAMESVLIYLGAVKQAWPYRSPRPWNALRRRTRRPRAGTTRAAARRCAAAPAWLNVPWATVANFEHLLAWQLALPRDRSGARRPATAWEQAAWAAKIGATTVGIGALFAVTGGLILRTPVAGFCKAPCFKMDPATHKSSELPAHTPHHTGPASARLRAACRSAYHPAATATCMHAGGLAAPAIAAGIGAAISLAGGTAAAAAGATGFLATAAGTATLASSMGVAGGSYAGAHMARRIGAPPLLPTLLPSARGHAHFPAAIGMHAQEHMHACLHGKGAYHITSLAMHASVCRQVKQSRNSRRLCVCAHAQAR